MSPGCCSLVSENKAKWLMLPCYCYIIYTSHLFLWLITGLVKYIGNVKRCGVRRDSVSVNLCRMSVGIQREICVKNGSFQGWSLEFTPLCAAGLLQPQQALSLGRTFFRVTNPPFFYLCDSFPLREPRAKMWLLLTWAQGAPKISACINHHRAGTGWAVNLPNSTARGRFVFSFIKMQQQELLRSGWLHLTMQQPPKHAFEVANITKWPKLGLPAEASV